MRNNQRRASARTRPAARAKTKQAPVLSYEVPIEFVELPSRGAFYPPGHPLHNVEKIEIRFMTAKEEDILSSETLITEGVAINRFLESIMIDDVDSTTLLVGDRSAIMIAARISGYGSLYEVNLTCPRCTHESEMAFDLNDKTTRERCFDEEFMGDNDVVINEQGLIETTLPVSNFKVQLRMLTAVTQEEYTNIISSSQDGGVVTSSLSLLIQKINDCEDRQQIDNVIQNLPAKDSRFIRSLFPKVTPTVELKKNFHCKKCGHKQEMEVPLTAAFFWPK